jgi:hypothetical protein
MNFLNTVMRNAFTLHSDITEKFIFLRGEDKEFKRLNAMCSKVQKITRDPGHSSAAVNLAKTVNS